jgi:hypothetical protein
MAKGFGLRSKVVATFFKIEDKEGEIITLNSEFGINIIDVKRFMDWIKSQNNTIR